MLKQPEAQRKAQTEIDTVVGPSRLPDFDDQEKLPYVNALVKEVLRWHPVVHLSEWYLRFRVVILYLGQCFPPDVPHRLKTDDVYDGYFLPAGSTVIANVW